MFVTVLCPLASDKFELVVEVELSFSWGFVECLVHRRLTDEAAELAAMLGESMAGMNGGGGGERGGGGQEREQGDADMDTE